MSEAARTLGVTIHQIRRLIQERVLAAEPVVAGAPYQIRANDRQSERVVAALARKARPYRMISQNQNPMFPSTEKGPA